MRGKSLMHICTDRLTYTRTDRLMHARTDTDSTFDSIFSVYLTFVYALNALISIYFASFTSFDCPTLQSASVGSVSYTHLTLPTKRIV